MGPRISVYAAVSVDGFIAGPGGDLGWLESAAAPGEDYGFDGFLAGVDAVAMGRGTYDVIEPVEELPYGDRPVYVFTHRPARPRTGPWSRRGPRSARPWPCGPRAPRSRPCT